MTLTGGTANFDSKDVGTGKTVTAIGLGLSGAQAGDYLLVNPTETATANVTPQGISGSVAANNKVFCDGTTAATLSGESLTGAVSR